MTKIKSKICKCLNCGKEFHPHGDTFGKYCSNKCQQEHRSALKYADYINDPSKYEGQTNMRWVRKFIMEEQKHKCAICGMEDTWQNKKLVFILDHLYGHADNNKRSNLRLVCPNCDSQLDTYKRKNKKSDRIYYHYHHR